MEFYVLLTSKVILGLQPCDERRCVIAGITVAVFTVSAFILFLSHIFCRFSFFFVARGEVGRRGGGGLPGDLEDGNIYRQGSDINGPPALGAKRRGVLRKTAHSLECGEAYWKIEQRREGLMLLPYYIVCMYMS